MKVLDFHGQYTLPGLRAALRPMRADGQLVGMWLVKVPPGEVANIKALPGFVPRDSWADFSGSYFGVENMPAHVFGSCENFVFEAVPA